MNSRWSIGIVLFTIFLLFAGPIASPVAADVEIVSGEVVLKPPGGAATKPRLEKDRKYGPTITTLLVRNPAETKATVAISGWLEDGTALSLTRVRGPGFELVSTTRDGTTKLDNEGQFSLPPQSLTPVEATIEHLGKSSKTKGHIVLGGPDVPKASIVPLKVERPTPLWYLWTPLLTGFILAVLLVGVRWATLRTFNPELPPLPKWTFKDGWASNVVVVGAVVASVLAAAGSLGSETFGDFALAKFVGLNLVFGGLVFVAPLVYAALRRTIASGGSRKTVGTVAGLMLGSGSTLWAAFGQLVAVVVLVAAAPHTPWELGLMSALALLAAAFVAVYAWNTIGWTCRGYKEAEAAGAAPQATQTLL